MMDNMFITGGYRRQTNSYTECIKSLFYLHNESGKIHALLCGECQLIFFNLFFAVVNIYSHLLGFIMFVGFGLHFLWSQPFSASLTVFDYTYFFVFIAGALICLGFSASFHCFACHSEKVAATWNRCDYAGITSLIV
jgi:adiponectin receptor